MRDNEDEVLRPATEKQIATLSAAVKKRWGVELPDGYLRFLRTCNGLDHNGLVIYGAGWSEKKESPEGFWQGLLFANDEWHEEGGYEEFLIFGDNDTDILAMSLKTKRFGNYDRGGEDLNEKYPSFEKMLSKALKDRL